MNIIIRCIPIIIEPFLPSALLTNHNRLILYTTFLTFNLSKSQTISDITDDESLLYYEDYRGEQINSMI